MTLGTSLQHHLAFLPGVTLLIFAGTRASCKPLASRLSIPRSHGRSPGTPTMFGVIIGRDVGLRGPLRLRKDPPTRAAHRHAGGLVMHPGYGS